jgi:hypothetical protein
VVLEMQTEQEGSMAYRMKSSPAKLMGALRIGAKVLKYGKKVFTKTTPKVVKSADDIEIDAVNKGYNRFKQSIRDKGTKK